MKSPDPESRNFYIQEEKLYLSFTTLPTFSYTQYDGLYFVFIQQELEMQPPKGQGKQSSSIKPTSVWLGNPDTFWVGGCTIDEAGDAGREKTDQLHAATGR